MRILESREETERNILECCLNQLSEEAEKVYQAMAAKQDELGIKLEENRFDMLALRQQEEWIKIFSSVAAEWHREGYADAFCDAIEEETK